MEKKMRKTLFTLTMVLCVAAVASVASIVAKNSNNRTAPDVTIKGFIMDKTCSNTKPMFGNEECALKCLSKGDAAVLVSEDEKVYRLDQQDKAREFGGKHVEVTGKVDGDSISITSIKRQ